MKSITLWRHGISFILGLCVFSTSYANDRIINISGLLVTKPCDLLTSEVDINFGVTNSPELMNDTAKRHDFIIRLNNCPSVNVRAKFIGNSTDNNQILNVSEDSTASGIGIRLYDERGHVVTFGEDTSSTIGVEGVVHILHFQAQVAKLQSIQSAGQIREGAFTATATYEVVYN
ncbi:fimbrial protein [Acinetobacter sp. ANC 4558]|uniref:fimbrial protein n=1 Tax=Acinetobacter sp. ANC 4558 TaxID=1977876 RepID=UPI00148A69A5|nr:fimbrial protein [Acinetobacter sp. ANC 4558]